MESNTQVAGAASRIQLARHSCPDCQQETINPPPRYVDKWTGSWLYTLKHSPAEIQKAASRGCPLFIWLHRQLHTSQTPSEQLKRTAIVLEFSTGNDTSVLVADGIRSVTIRVSTIHYTWSAGGFEVVSSFGKLRVSIVFGLSLQRMYS
jgi:hypothetical protein